MTEPFGWFDLAWPWIGLAAAAVVVVALFATPWLRSDPARPRRSDPRWIGFLAVAVYLVHQVEEYGIAANGVAHAFPDELCAVVGQAAYPVCPIPPAFFLAVNVTLVWVAAPIAATLAPRAPLLGLVLWGVIAANAVVHIAPAIVLRRYDAGLLTAVLLFLPLALWAMAGMTGERRPIPRRAVGAVIAAGVLMHAVLGASLVLFLHAGVPAWALITLQPLAVIAGYGLTVAAQHRLDVPSGSAARTTT